MNYYCLKYHEVCKIQKCGKCPQLDEEGHCDCSMNETQFNEERPDQWNCDECLWNDECEKKGCGDLKP